MLTVLFSHSRTPLILPPVGGQLTMLGWSAMASLKSLLEVAPKVVATTIRALSGNYTAHGQMAEVDCVIAYSFGFQIGDCGEVQPGDTNAYLAAEVIRRRDNKPVIAQHEIYDALEQGYGYTAFARIPPDEEKYLDTREVAEKSIAIMRAEGWITALVIAHPHHLPRTDLVTMAMGVRTVVPAGIKPVWDSHSDQKWTRSPWAWARRETLAIAYYAGKGWLTIPNGHLFSHAV